MPLMDFQQRVDATVRDDTGTVSSTDRDLAIDEAVTRYSKDRPRRIAEDVVADGTQFLVMPEAWVAGFSEVMLLEYPVGDVPPSERTDHSIYNGPDGEQITVEGAIDSGDTVRVHFGVFHTLDEAEDSIPRADREAVCNYAAALLLDQLAHRYSGSTDSTIAADAVDRGSRGRDYASRAKALRERYYQEMGIDPKRNIAAGVVVDLDGRDSEGNARLLHPERWR